MMIIIGPKAGGAFRFFGGRTFESELDYDNEIQG